ncbi:hypothetical protein EJB05_06169 [Eragrostis curvula]|uniref:KIB1-4 beta-propeller domain-containing protein n=1 Tax=Eragrostis curvula TaxID=38414 RepID=A0A5J9WD49_9POAL|nr:hypothetical protein EJB05_06169 [Eragrostis curvula]
MTGSRGGRRVRRRSPSPLDESSPPQQPATPKEVAVSERPSKRTGRASNSTSFSTSGPDVWADLLECLLHQIIALLSSFHDRLAFRSTCRYWRSTFFSFPSAFSSSLPPLLLKPLTRYPSRDRRQAVYSFLYNCEWQLIDPVKQSSSCRRSPPLNPPKGMNYLGCSYGHLIFCNLDHCLLVDAYGGTVVRSPKLKSTDNCKIVCGTLVAPLNSPNSYLLLLSASSLFQWEVGTDSWLQHPLDLNEVTHTVFFKGEMFAINCDGLYTIHLTPQLIVHEVAVDWDDRPVEQADGTVLKITLMYWVVACGDMLLLVELLEFKCGDWGIFEVFRLDFSVEPAKWVKVKNLGNYSLFISFSLTSPAFSCMNPERWGGKSNSIYVANHPDADEPWTVVELGQAVPRTTWNFPYLSEKASQPHLYVAQPENLWVHPSLVYRVGQ